MSQTELMTVREMIDAAIIYDMDQEPVVNFKLIESVLLVIASQLNVLERRVLVRYREVKQGLAKKQAKRKTKVTVIRIHGKAAGKPKDSSTADSTTEESSFSRKKQSTSRRNSRSRSRSKSRSRSRSYSKEISTKPAKGKRKIKDLAVLHEKLLVVSRTSREGQREVDHRKSIVTQDQYDRMLDEVRKLQVKFGVIPNVDSGWSNIHQPTSFTDPRAAINLATRLEISHKRLNEMLIAITKFASSVPGINLDATFDGKFFLKPSKHTPSSKETGTDIEAPFDEKILQKPSKDTPRSEQILKTTSKASTDSTESEKILVDTDKPPEEEIDYENLANWPEFDGDINNIRQTIIKDMSEKASATAEVAKKAAAMFKESAPRLSEASLLNVRLAKLRVLVDRFTAKVNIVDTNMAAQMSEAQESVSNMQYEVELIVERIDDCLAHPAEDPAAVAAIKEDFMDMHWNLANAKNSQTNLQESHTVTATDFEKIRNRIQTISQVKTTREEALEALKYKARVTDVNGLLARYQLCAVEEFLQRKIYQTKDGIEAGEQRWQITLDDYMTYLNEKCDRMQVITLNNSLRDHYDMMRATVNTMLNIVGDFPVNIYKKKLDQDGNCLSCGTPANAKVSEETLKLVKQIFVRQAANPKIKMDQGVILPKPCIPGRPIPHAPDPRALFCDRYCGASLSKTIESTSSSLGLDVMDINPSHMTGMKKRVHLTCSPCTLSEETLLK